MHKLGFGNLAWKSVEHRWVIGLVFVNLEAEELVDRADGGGIETMDHYTAAIGSVHGGVGNFTGEALHVGNSWRNGVVDEHGNVEIAGREGVRDVREMPADAVDRVAVFGIVGSDLNDAAVSFEQEVMRGSRLGEGHAFFAALVHSGMIVRRKRGVGRWLWIGGSRGLLPRSGPGKQRCGEDEREAGFDCRCYFQIEADGETRRGAWQGVRLATEPKFVKDGNLFVVRAIRAWFAVQGWCAICS